MSVAARFRRLASLTAALLLAGAAAGDRPLFLPVRDVTVTYRLISEPEAPAPGRQTHMYFSAALNKLRLDEPTLKGYLVIDRGAQQVIVVMPQQRAYSVLPFDPEMAGGFILNDQMQFSRGPTESVAGLPCTRWEVIAARAAGTVCVTDDGVLLSGRGRRRENGIAGLEAVSVSYAPQPDSLFIPPPGYSQLLLPGGRVP